MLNIDRYHATMGDASYKDVTRLHETLLSEAEATFYAAQRKLPYAPCLGHERRIRSFLDLRIARLRPPDDARLNRHADPHGRGPSLALRLQPAPQRRHRARR